MAESLEDALKAQARALGFDAVAIAEAAPFEPERAYLAARLASGGETAFEHPDHAERVEPDRLLSGVRAIVALAVSYHHPDPEPAEGLHGWYSRYCRGLDYHTLIEERLKALADWLEARAPGTVSLGHVDTGPPLDRAIAARAGLGKFGKSTMLIAPKLGTWTFLAELLTTAPLQADPPLAFSPCGSCRRCLDACPTGAIGEWTLDANRCLGYINQMDGAVPEALREAMGLRLFGCDDCQDVCPYNRAASFSSHPELAPLGSYAEMTDLPGLLAMTPEAFEHRFGPTAAAWRGLETLQRNALVALGNSGAASALGPLLSGLSAASPLLRAHAAWGLGRIAPVAPEALEALKARGACELDPEVRREIDQAIAGSLR